MKRKLIARNKAFLTNCLKRAGGWPLGLWLYDNYSKQTVVEGRYYRWLDKDSRTKRGRKSGDFYHHLGIEPSRYCVGKGGSVK